MGESTKRAGGVILLRGGLSRVPPFWRTPSHMVDMVVRAKNIKVMLLFRTPHSQRSRGGPKIFSLQTFQTRHWICRRGTAFSSCERWSIEIRLAIRCEQWCVVARHCILLAQECRAAHLLCILCKAHWEKTFSCGLASWLAFNLPTFSQTQVPINKQWKSAQTAVYKD